MRTTETVLTTIFGIALGGLVGFLVGGIIGLVIGASMSGLNGLIGGIKRIYDWTDIRGWISFLTDSTWGLIGTSLGHLLHFVNLLWPDSNYSKDLSYRRNRYVYQGGFRLKDGFAFTQGCVISDAGANDTFITQHEGLHVWQNRIFGPLFLGIYVAWLVGGAIVGTIVWFFHTDQKYGSIVETVAYYDNPFEYWAYKNNNNWPPARANPIVRWGGVEATLSI